MDAPTGTVPLAHPPFELGQGEHQWHRLCRKVLQMLPCQSPFLMDKAATPQASKCQVIKSSPHWAHWHTFAPRHLDHIPCVPGSVPGDQQPPASPQSAWTPSIQQWPRGPCSIPCPVTAVAHKQQRTTQQNCTPGEVRWLHRIPSLDFAHLHPMQNQPAFQVSLVVRWPSPLHLQHELKPHMSLWLKVTPKQAAHTSYPTGAAPRCILGTPSPGERENRAAKALSLPSVTPSIPHVGKQAGARHTLHPMVPICSPDHSIFEVIVTDLHCECGDQFLLPKEFCSYFAELLIICLFKS